MGSHQLERYTALKAHPENEGPVHQILFNDKGVISLAAKSVHLMNRRALTQWHIEYVVSFDDQDYALIL